MSKIKKNKKRIIAFSFLGIGILSLCSLAFLLTNKNKENNSNDKNSSSLIENIKTTGLGIKKVSSGHNEEDKPYSEYKFEIKPENSLNKKIKVHSLVWNQIRNEKNEIYDENGNKWDDWNYVISNKEKNGYSDSPSNYINVEIDNENSQFKITCNKDFGFQIKLILTSEENESVTAEILLDYEEKFLGYPEVKNGVPISKKIEVMTIDENTIENFMLSNHDITNVEKGIYLVDFFHMFREAYQEYFTMRPEKYSYGSVKLIDKGFYGAFDNENTVDFSCTTLYYNYQIHSVNYSNAFFLRNHFGKGSLFANLIETKDLTLFKTYKFNKSQLIQSFNNVFKTMNSTEQMYMFNTYDKTIPFSINYSFKLKEINTNELSPLNLTFSFVFNISKNYLTTNFVKSIAVETKQIIF